MSKMYIKQDDGTFKQIFLKTTTDAVMTPDGNENLTTILNNINNIDKETLKNILLEIYGFTSIE